MNQERLAELQDRAHAVDCKIHDNSGDPTPEETADEQKDLDTLYITVEDEFNAFDLDPENEEYLNDNENPYQGLVEDLLDMQTTVDDHRRWLLR